MSIRGSTLSIQLENVFFFFEKRIHIVEFLLDKNACNLRASRKRK
jgi:hypothetical protein